MVKQLVVRKNEVKREIKDTIDEILFAIDVYDTRMFEEKILKLAELNREYRLVVDTIDEVAPEVKF